MSVTFFFSELFYSSSSSLVAAVLQNTDSNMALADDSYFGVVWLKEFRLHHDGGHNKS